MELLSGKQQRTVCNMQPPGLSCGLEVCTLALWCFCSGMVRQIIWKTWCLSLPSVLHIFLNAPVASWEVSRRLGSYLRVRRFKKIKKIMTFLWAVLAGKCRTVFFFIVYSLSFAVKSCCRLISGKIAKVYMKLLLLMDIIFNRKNNYPFFNPSFSLFFHPSFL